MGRPPSWTDEQLREAVAASTSWRAVVQRLRAEAGGSSHRAVVVRAEVLGLDTAHFGRPRARPSGSPDRRRWSDDELAAAVAEATSLKGVFDVLGLVPGGGQWQLVRQLILELGLETDHWKSPLHPGASSPTWDDGALGRAVRDSRSVAEVMRRLGVRPGGRAQRAVRRRIDELGLSTDHMTGQGWARGRRNPDGRSRAPLEELLVSGGHVQTARLRQRLIDEGILAARCAICQGDTWLGGPMPLELDHINGDRRDNRIENLRLLCPNCHAGTETYRGRNIGRYDGRGPSSTRG